MPIPPPVKAVLRKDLLLGGGAGAVLCAVIVGVAIDRAAGNAAVPDQVTVRLRPQLPGRTGAASAGAPLALQANLDVIDAVNGNGVPGDGAPPPMAMRVRMALAAAPGAAPDAAPTVADAGDGDGQSNVIALTVPLAAFTAPDSSGPSGGNDDDAPPPADANAPAPT